MPLYEYGCISCQATIERRQSFEEPLLSECPDCGGELRRLLRPIGIIFKGSGWYCTDNRANKGDAGTETSKPKAEASVA